MLNPAPAQALPDELIDLCDVVIPNEHEVELLGGAMALLDRGVGTVITTRGAAGVTVTGSDPDGSTVEWHQDPFAVEAVDTTGAGDAFCGALGRSIRGRRHDALRGPLRRRRRSPRHDDRGSCAVPPPRFRRIQRLLAGSTPR